MDFKERKDGYMEMFGEKKGRNDEIIISKNKRNIY